MARKACRRSAEENRKFLKSGGIKARLSVWQVLLKDMRERLWEGQARDIAAIDLRMVYIASVFCF